MAVLDFGVLTLSEAIRLLLCTNASLNVRPHDIRSRPSLVFVLDMLNNLRSCNKNEIRRILKGRLRSATTDQTR